MSEKEAGSVLTSENAEEFYANRLGLADNDSNEAVEETPAEPEESEEQSGQEEIKATEEKKQNPKLEKRFSELTKQREQAKQELAKEREARASLEARLSEFESKSKPAVEVKTDSKPLPADFADAFEYAEALATYAAENALRVRDKQDAERVVQAERDKVLGSWQERMNATKAELPDYEDMVQSSDVVVSDQVRDAILESEVGPRILYHLAENPEIGTKLNSMSMASALKEIGKLEARFENSETVETKPAVAKSKAPAPIKPIGSTSSAIDAGIDSNGEFRGSYQQWKQSRQAGKIR